MSKIPRYYINIKTINIKINITMNIKMTSIYNKLWNKQDEFLVF
jgi:hypothetical protein